jgi:hypothetical protein
MTNTPLPEDWDRLLERFTKTLAGLQQTLASTEADIAPAPSAPSTEAYAPLLASKAQYADGLSRKAADITQWVDAIESELRVSEDLLRVLLSQTEAVRQKLATWASRAIG